MTSSRRRRRSSKKKGGESHSDIFSPLVQKTVGGGNCPYSRPMRGGGCPRQMGPQMGGGVLFPSSFNHVPIRSFYSQNTFNSDPNYLTVASRNTGSFYGGGGKHFRKNRSNKHKHNKTNKKMRGGFSFFSIPQMPKSTLYDVNNPPKE